MGGHPWWYFVPHKSDIEAALQELREREFKAGRYNPAMRFPQFPLTPESPSLGPRHASIDKALVSSGEGGTRSILDMMTVSTTPDYNVVSPLRDNTLKKLFGTTQPTHEAIEESDTLFENLERGKGVYIIVYSEGVPSEILFLPDTRLTSSRASCLD